MEAEQRRRRSLLPVLVPVLLVSVLALAAVTYRLPYYALAPGAAQSVDSLIDVPAGRAFPHRGQFLLMSVSLRGVTPFEFARARRNPDVELVRMRALLGVEPTKEARRQFDADLRSSMQISQHVAVVVAFARLGLPLPQAGDTAEAVRIDAAGVNGSSGGLALTLGLLEALGSGELAGGHRVAVTGTIAPSGKVGEVDGVAQKTAAARAAGADYLLVPPGGYDVAVAHAGRRLRVVKVSTLDEALSALAAIGGELGQPR